MIKAQLHQTVVFSVRRWQLVVFTLSSAAVLALTQLELLLPPG